MDEVVQRLMDGLEKSGISQAKGVGIHSLRHTYASFLLKASKFNLRLVQRQLV